MAEQEVDVEAALVRLVDDDRVVGTQQRIALRLGEQDAVGHQLDAGAGREPVLEADLVADDLAERRLQLLGDAPGDARGGDAARLGVADQAAAGAPRPRPSARAIFGSCVVLPEPVSPQTMTTWWAPSAAAISSRRAETGSASGNSIGGSRVVGVARRREGSVRGPAGARLFRRRRSDAIPAGFPYLCSRRPTTARISQDPRPAPR